MPRALFLLSHVFLCRAQRHWVVLDVRRDKYLCVDRRQLESLGPWIGGWDETGTHSATLPGEPPAEAIALAERLLSLGILSEHAVDAKDARATAYPEPTAAVDLDSLERTPSAWWAYTGSFFLSCSKAARQLRNERFEAIIASVKARKNRNLHRAAGTFDIERAGRLLAVFDRLRWFYPRPYLCLFDSLALTHFLARFGLYPDWVFGVKADPFEAHCWVQTDRTVLNDTIGHVAGFTPMMHV